MQYSDPLSWVSSTGVTVSACGPGHHDSNWSWQTDGSVQQYAFSVLLIVEGVCGIEFGDGHKVKASRGDMLLMRWDHARREYNAGDQKLLAPWCSFDWNDRKQHSLHVDLLPALIHRHIPDHHYVFSCMARVIDAYLVGNSAEAEVYMASALAEFSHGLSAERKSRDLWAEKIQKVCRRVQAEPEIKWSISDLAQEHSCTPDHFARVFQRIVGDSPGRYFIRCRLDRASFMLRHTDLSIKYIANHLGYYDAYAFSKQFKKFIGMSPSNFRLSD